MLASENERLVHIKQTLKEKTEEKENRKNGKNSQYYL